MILSRVKISPQQRYDLEDFTAGQAAERADSKYWVKKFLTEGNLIMGGFTVSGVGLTSATIAMADSALLLPQSSFDFSYFTSATGDPDITLTDADLVDGVRNYVEAQLSTLDGVPLVKAFWDPEANSGAGAEFNQIVNTITDIQVTFVVSTGGFSGDPDKVPVAIIDTDGSGVIKVILDRRELFGRLSKPNDLDNEYAWGSKVEPVYSLTLTGVSGTFTAGEEISIGSETATVVTGGAGSITFNEPTGINFSNGDSVVGTDSGATGTVNTVFESFLGVDKNLSTEKKRFDALATEIKLMKGTRFWWQNAGPSLAGLKQEVMSTIAGVSASAQIVWNGTRVRITDASLTPAQTDNIAAIRLLNSTHNLYLRRQDDGKEVVTVTVPEVPTSGTLTLDQNGNLIPIAWDDTAADIQATWNGSGAYAAVISGDLSSKKIVITAAAAGLQVDVITDANTLMKSGSPVSETITVKQGMAFDTSLAIGDGQVLYVDIPSPVADINYSGGGGGATNYKVVDRGDPALSDSTYWLAYREGSRLIWRFSGELEANEATAITDNVPQSLLDAIGLLSETSLPAYSSDIRGVLEESIVSRSGVLTDNAGDPQEDRSGYLRSDDEVSWTANELTFTADIVLELVNTKDGTLTQHTVDAAQSPIALNDEESAWILIDRTDPSEACVVKYSDTDPIPAQTQAGKDVFILFRRKDANALSYLHIPFHKQLMEADQLVRLGASGSGSGIPPLFIQETPTGAVDGVNATFTISAVQKTDESILVLVDELAALQSHYNVVGQNIVFTAGNIPALGQSVSVFFVADTTNTVAGIQETPTGAVDGSNDTFILSGNPPYKNAVLVIVDGRILSSEKWNLVQSISSSSIQFTAGNIPALGQSVRVMYFTLDVTITMPPMGTDTRVEYRTVSAPEAAAKQLTLLDTPAVPTKTMVDVITVGAQFYGSDFNVSGAVLNWSALGMDSIPIVNGSKLRIVYFL